MRVLLVTSRFPLPPWRGNQVRTVEWLEALTGHDVLLICPEPARGVTRALASPVRYFPLRPFSRTLSLLRAGAAGLPLQEGLYDGSAARRTVSSAVSQWRPDVVIVQMVRCAWAAETAMAATPAVPVIFDSIDAMGLHFDRAADSAPPLQATVFRIEAARCHRRERMLADGAVLSVAVSERDLAALAAPDDRGRVIPVAGRRQEPVAVEKTDPVVLLSGNLGYRPTVGGAEWFAREVWPRVLEKCPDARWVLAGARPAAAARRLSRLPGVEIHSDVPDLAAFLMAARATIAPMSSGSGVPMKVLEALAAGVPAVVHQRAAAGLGSDAHEAVAVALNADEWVDTIVDLLSDPHEARDLGHRGRDLWRRVYHPDRVADQIRAVVAEAAGTKTFNV
jgi:glycosyltransferase involved in cell wall biosynthesis